MFDRGDLCVGVHDAHDGRVCTGGHSPPLTPVHQVLLIPRGPEDKTSTKACRNLFVTPLVNAAIDAFKSVEGRGQCSDCIIEHNCKARKCVDINP